MPRSRQRQSRTYRLPCDKARRAQHNKAWLYREQRNLCQCPDADDVRVCFGQAELEAAKQQPHLHCADCGRERLRIEVAVDIGTAEASEEIRQEMASYYRRQITQLMK